MEGGLLLDVVVGESAAILELLAGEDETLLVGGNAAEVRQQPVIPSPLKTSSPLLVLDLGLDVVNGV